MAQKTCAWWRLSAICLGTLPVPLPPSTAPHVSSRVTFLAVTTTLRVPLNTAVTPCRTKAFSSVSPSSSCHITVHWPCVFHFGPTDFYHVFCALSIVPLWCLCWHRPIHRSPPVFTGPKSACFQGLNWMVTSPSSLLWLHSLKEAAFLELPENFNHIFFPLVEVWWGGTIYYVRFSGPPAILSQHTLYLP